MFSLLIDGLRGRVIKLRKRVVNHDALETWVINLPPMAMAAKMARAMGNGVSQMPSGCGASREHNRRIGGIPCHLAAIALASAIICRALPALAQDPEPSPCTEDAMLVFDASGSMSSNTWGHGSEGAHTVSRIDMVRYALGKILPSVTRFRRVGLMTYGPTHNPGLFNQCDNIELNLPPTPNAAARIMASVQSLVPVGGTPLTRAVEQGAEVLDFRSKPGVIVVLTDGEDTCGGSPCRVAKELHTAAAQLTIHVIGLQVGEGSIGEAQCLTDYNGGLYLAPETTDDLIAALEKTLGCPMVSRHSRD
jgi:Ca-activated chloride channel family protein